jgi:sugar phosphate isomerase/epimerase
MEFKLAAFADEAASELYKQIAIMKKNGISYLEIRGVDGQNVADISEQKAKEICSSLEGENLSVWSIGSPFGKIGIGENFDVHLEKFKHTLEIANILGTTHFRLFSFYMPSGEEEKYKDKVLEQLNKFVEAAQGTGIILCHENEKGIYGSNAERCLEIHKAIPELKAIFDPANFIQCGQDTKEAWRMLSPYVEYLHIKDAMGDGSVVPAGKGIGNLPYILSEYKGQVLTLEPHLTVFKGLENLENKDKSKINQYSYSSSTEAFSAAVNALKELIK